MHLASPPPNLDLAGGIALLGAALVQAVKEPVPVPEGIGGWVVWALMTLGLGGVAVWALRRKLEDYFAAQAAERENERATREAQQEAERVEREAHRQLLNGQMEALREQIERVVAQRDALVTEVIKDLRADRDFYRNAFLDERHRADERRVRPETE